MQFSTHFLVLTIIQHLSRKQQGYPGQLLRAIYFTTEINARAYQPF